MMQFYLYQTARNIQNWMLAVEILTLGDISTHWCLEGVCLNTERGARVACLSIVEVTGLDFEEQTATLASSLYAPIPIPFCLGLVK